MLGVTASSLTSQDHVSLSRAAGGVGTSRDFARVFQGAGGGWSSGITMGDLNRASLGDQFLGAVHGHAPQTVAGQLAARGVRGLGRGDVDARVREEVNRITAARAGVVFGGSSDALGSLIKDSADTNRRMVNARLMAAGAGDSSLFYTAMGGDADAVDAYRANRGMEAIGSTPSLLGLGQGGRLSLGMIGRDLGRLGAAGVGMAAVGAGAMGSAAAAGSQIARLFSGGGGGLETWQAMRTFEDRSAGSLHEFVQGTAGRMERRAGMTGAEAEERVSATRARLRSMGASEEGISNVTGAMLRGRVGQAAIAGGLRGVSAEQLSLLTNNEEFRTAAGRLTGASTREQVAEEIRLLEAQSQTVGGDAGTAMAGVAASLRQNLTGDGLLNRRAQRVLRESTVDPQRMIELERQRLDTSRFFAGAAGRMEVRDGDFTSELIRNQMRALGNAWAGGDAASAESFANNLRYDVAALDPNSEEYRNASRAFGSGAMGQQWRQQVSQTRQYMRDATGQGRRGSRGAADTLLGMLTGGSMSEVNVEVSRGGRTRRVSNTSSIMQMLRGGGGDGDAAATALSDQLVGLGVKDGEEIVQQFRRDAQSGRGIDASEARRLEERMRESGVHQRVQDRQREQTLAGQRNSDPLGNERNTILRDILGVLRNTPRTDEVEGAGITGAATAS
jgi:hypothetical protein